MLLALFPKDRAAAPRLLRRWQVAAADVAVVAPDIAIACDANASSCQADRWESHHAGVAVAFDGCLDNRSDLLTLEPRLRVNCSDAELISVLYGRFGHGVINRLLGDFRIVIADRAAGSVLAAVDFACTQRMWWRDCGDAVIFASSISDLYSPDESLPLNDDYLMERVAIGWSDGPSGPFRGATRIRGGEYVVATRGSVRVSKYWCPTRFAAGVDNRSNADCIEGFRHGLRTAVARRIPKEGSVICDLSGGLDSTTVTTMAASILGPDTPHRLHAVTVAYPGAARSDERSPASIVAQATGVNHHILDRGEHQPLYWGMPDSAFYWDEPRFSVHAHATAVAKHQIMSKVGARVSLNGLGAELVLSEHLAWPLFLADSVIRGRWLAAFRGLRYWQRASEVQIPILVYRSCIMPFIRPRVALLDDVKQTVPAWLTPEARRRTRTAIDRKPQVNLWNIGGAWLADQWTAASCMAEQGYSEYAYKSRYPFLDRSLVETVFSMPWTVRVRPSQSKYLLRQLSADFLPQGIRTRHSLTADQTVSQAMARQDLRLRGFTKSLAIAELGYADGALFRSAIAAAQQGTGTNMRSIIGSLSLELWLQSVLSGAWRRQRARQGRSRPPQLTPTFTYHDNMQIERMPCIAES